MKNMTLNNIANACGAEIVGTIVNPSQTIEGAVVDSRLVQQDYLFFAAKGERVDGHDYIAQAFQKGALAVVCERIPEGVQGIFLLVKNAYAALYDIALFYRNQLDIQVVGISGSVGKTSTKEFVASVLGTKYRVLKTDMNFNNEIGVPLMVLKIRDEHEIAVLEMGISDFQEMSRLAALTQPNICLLTNIGQCHLEKLIDRDGVKKAKTEMFDYMKKDGSVVLFGDDDKLREITEVNGNKPIFYGTDSTCSVYTKDIIQRGLWGNICTIVTPDSTFKAEITLPGKHMIYNALAATAVGTLFSLGTEEISKGIAAVGAVAGRSRLLESNGLTIIDDCYNANPSSMRAALDILSEAVTRKVAVLGDMFELGENERKLHEEVGEYAVKKADELICIGNLSEFMYQAAARVRSQENPANTEHIHYFKTKEEFLQNMQTLICIEDAVLLKASHGMEFTKLLEEMTGEGVKFPTLKAMAEQKKEDMIQGLNPNDKNMTDKEKSRVENNEETKEEIKEERKTAAEESQNAEEKKIVMVPIDTGDILDREEESDSLEKSNFQEESEDVREDSEEATEKEESSKGIFKASEGKKIAIVAGIIAVVLVLLAGAIFVFVLQKDKLKTQGLLAYTKGSALLAAQGTKGVEYTPEFVAGSSDVNTTLLLVDELVTYQATDKTVYYSKNTMPGVQTFDLYYNKSNGKQKNEEFINSMVTKYEIDDNNNVFYLRENALYRYDAKEETSIKIADETTDFYLQEDGAAIAYLSAGAMYYKDIKGDGQPIILDQDAISIVSANKDFESVIYSKIDGLYVLTKERNKIHLATDAQILTINNPDKKFEIYYIKAEDTGATLADYMDDDLKSGEEETVFREQMQNIPLGIDMQTLCYYKEGMDEPKEISDSLSNIRVAQETDGLLMVTQNSVKKSNKVSMRECFKEQKDIESIERSVMQSVNEAKRQSIVKNGKITALKKYDGSEVMSDVYFNKNKIYFISANATGLKYVYEAKTSGFSKGSTKLIDSDANSVEGVFAKDVYYTVFQDGCIKLKNLEGLICGNVIEGSVSQTMDQESILYVDGNYNLCCRNDGISMTIVENVSKYYVGITNKNIWYIKNYIANTQVGDLCNYNGKEEKTVDTNVSGMMFLQ